MPVCLPSREACEALGLGERSSERLKLFVLAGGSLSNINIVRRIIAGRMLAGTKNLILRQKSALI